MLMTRPLRKQTSFSQQSSIDKLRPNVSKTMSDPLTLTNLKTPGQRGSPAHLAADFGKKSRVLHVGCGTRSPSRLHGIFDFSAWEEIRCDIDQSNQPDIVSSIVDMRECVDDDSCDAVWASHILEHLSRHEVSPALAEFSRVLSSNGFVLLRSPDIEAIAQFIIDGRINDVIYVSAAGPITPLDMIYGHGAAIAQKKDAMRHGTAFTQELIGKDLLKAGFSEVRTTRTETYEVWAVAFMPDSNSDIVLEQLALTGIDFRS